MRTVRSSNKTKYCKRCHRKLGIAAFYKKVVYCLVCYHKTTITNDYRNFKKKFSSLATVFIAWLTGFYEGEGSLTDIKGKRTHNLRITQKEKKPLTIIMKFLKCGHLLLEQRKNYVYRYNITKIGIIAALLTTLLPFMKSRIKSNTAKLFLKKYYKYYERR